MSSLSCIPYDLITYLTYSYDSFKIFMGLPTTGGPAKQEKKD